MAAPNGALEKSEVVAETPAETETLPDTATQPELVADSGRADQHTRKAHRRTTRQTTPRVAQLDHLLVCQLKCFQAMAKREVREYLSMEPYRALIYAMGATGIHQAGDILLSPMASHVERSICEDSLAARKPKDTRRVRFQSTLGGLPRQRKYNLSSSEAASVFRMVGFEPTELNEYEPSENGSLPQRVI